jgi:hypothetical protein
MQPVEDLEMVQVKSLMWVLAARPAAALIWYLLVYLERS